MDIADEAAMLEAAHRQAAIDNRNASHSDPPQNIDPDGTVRCVDCDAVIPPERLKARPDAARCIHCQAAHETREARRGSR